MSSARALVVVCLFLVGCAAGKPAGDGGAGGICPSNPSQCGGKCCGNKCADITTDPVNCGDCGKVCDSGLACQGSVCGCPQVDKNGNVTAVPCGTGQTCCGVKTGCKNLTNDANNCGSCGRTCGSGGSCVGGQCKCGTATCTGSQVCCNGSCADTCNNLPDMATPPQPDGGVCACAYPCIVSCLAGCCIEEIIAGVCNPDPNCAM